MCKILDVRINLDHLEQDEILIKYLSKNSDQAAILEIDKSKARSNISTQSKISVRLIA